SHDREGPKIFARCNSVSPSSYFLSKLKKLALEFRDFNSNLEILET
ncbi:21942_t:CDS:1, partial [Entrophospora sp. SA101]